MSLPSANTTRILIDKYRSPIVLAIIVNPNPSDLALAASEYFSPLVAAVPVTTRKESVGLTTHIKFERPISGCKVCLFRFQVGHHCAFDMEVQVKQRQTVLELQG